MKYAPALSFGTALAMGNTVVTGTFGEPGVAIVPVQSCSLTSAALDLKSKYEYSPGDVVEPLLIVLKASARSVMRETVTFTLSTLTVSIARPSASTRGRMTPSPLKPT